jgi:hypothetical protein
MSYMCPGRDCPLKKDCYRFTREPNKNQEYYKNTPYDERGCKCDFYLPEWVIQELKQQNNATNKPGNGKKRRSLDQQ